MITRSSHRTSGKHSLIAITVGLVLGSACYAEQPSPEVHRASVSKPVLGSQAKLGVTPLYYDVPGIKGRLLYGVHTFFYGKNGYSRPWETYFVVRDFGLTSKEKGAGPQTRQVASYRVNARDYALMLQTRLSPDGNRVSFFVGSGSAPWNTYGVHIYDLTSHTQDRIDWFIGLFDVLWSPNSRFVAYFRGGFEVPSAGSYREPMQLWVYDLKEHQSRFVVEHEKLDGNVAWTKHNQIIYSLVPGKEDMLAGKPATAYLFDPLGKAGSVAVVDDAILPTPSPDGKWIAAFSHGKLGKSTDAEQTKTTLKLSDANASATDKEPGAPEQPAQHGKAETFDPHKQRLLRLFPKADGDPVTVSNKADFHRTELLWAPDSRHLYRVEKYYLAKGAAQAIIYEYSLSTKKDKQIACIKYDDREGRDWHGLQPLFIPVTVTNDGKFLLFRLLEGRDDPAAPVRM